MKIAEVELPSSIDGFCQWLVVEVKGEYVDISVEYTTPRFPERRTDPEAGIMITADKVEAVIEALQRAVLVRTEDKP